ncbi:EAL domain-containing protein (putative c-di-GMP-specific phosphodiesterase class I) [Bradyrhizobium yuanmingense]|uniref:EAL domain-containing protein n=1 Tax=Bradyrhizobium yuanmingense TaxID=108015 RepID=UPI00351815FE
MHPALGGLTIEIASVEAIRDLDFLAEIAPHRQLALGYDAHAVAEGVESGADLMIVSELGFDLVQGYVFGKPMPLKKFVEAL